jgi:hypothetical protein
VSSIITVKRTANEPATWQVLAILDSPHHYAARRRFAATVESEQEALRIAGLLMDEVLEQVGGDSLSIANVPRLSVALANASATSEPFGSELGSAIGPPR